MKQSRSGGTRRILVFQVRKEEALDVFHAQLGEHALEDVGAERRHGRFSLVSEHLGPRGERNTCRIAGAAVAESSSQWSHSEWSIVAQVAKVVAGCVEGVAEVGRRAVVRPWIFMRGISCV